MRVLGLVLGLGALLQRSAHVDFQIAHAHSLLRALARLVLPTSFGQTKNPLLILQSNKFHHQRAKLN